MAAQVKPVPDNYPTLNPYLIVRDGAAAVGFYQRVFGARERMRMPAPQGKIGHAELEMGNSLIMLADEAPQHDAFAPDPARRGGVSLHIYVPDVDAVVRKAEEEGAQVIAAVETRFYGDRLGTIRDPFGHVWHVSTHVEDVSPEEIGRRAAALGEG
jgi:PhnB protein